MHQQGDIHKPNPADVVHCILYVISPCKTNLDDMSICMNSMIEFLKSKNSEGNIWLFLLNTYILFIHVRFNPSIMLISILLKSLAENARRFSNRSEEELKILKTQTFYKL